MWRRGARTGAGWREGGAEAWRSRDDVEVVERAADAEAAAVEDVGVNHGGGNIAMAEQFLDCSNVVACFQ